MAGPGGDPGEGGEGSFGGVGGNPKTPRAVSSSAMLQPSFLQSRRKRCIRSYSGKHKGVPSRCRNRTLVMSQSSCDPSQVTIVLSCPSLIVEVVSSIFPRVAPPLRLRRVVFGNLSVHLVCPPSLPAIVTLPSNPTCPIILGSLASLETILPSGRTWPITIDVFLAGDDVLVLG